MLLDQITASEHRDRQTDRQTETDSQAGRQAGRQIERDRKQRDRDRERKAHRAVPPSNRKCALQKSLILIIIYYIGVIVITERLIRLYKRLIY